MEWEIYVLLAECDWRHLNFHISPAVAVLYEKFHVTLFATSLKLEYKCVWIVAFLLQAAPKKTFTLLEE